MSFARKHPGRMVIVHAHSDNSDGMKFDYILIKNSDIEAIAMTDHHNIYGIVEHIKEMKKIGKKALIGTELYISNMLESLNVASSNHMKKYYHLPVLVKNKTGWKNLLRLLSISRHNKISGKSVVKFEDFVKYHEGLICLSGCLAGEIPQYLLHNQKNYAETAAIVLKELFGDDFYLEIQRHGLKEEKITEPGLIELADKLGIKLVATPDAHYLTKKDKILHEILMCKKYQKTISDPKRMVLEGDSYALLTPVEEWEELYSDRLDALDSTIEIMEKCQDFDIEDVSETGNYHYPKFETPEGFSEASYFLKQSYEGFDNLVSEGIIENTPEYTQRLDKESNIILEGGLAGYFLIVQDFINYAKKKNIWVGPGRGSAAGSLISLSLGITKVLDPVKYKFLFERFLNSSRKEMPDIDVDFCFERRHEVIEYAQKKYNTDPDRPHVAFITSFNKWGAKSGINDVGKILEYEDDFYRGISKLVPNIPGISLKEALKQSKELRERYESEKKVKTIVDYAMKLEGTKSSISRHPAGLIIADKPLDNYTALETGIDADTKQEITLVQCDMKSSSALGLIKVDFLSLATGTEITDTLSLVNEKNRRLGLDEIKNLDNIPLDDSDVYMNIFAKGNTVGVFQSESFAMTKLLKQIFSIINNNKDRNYNMFLALVLGICMERPGTKDSIPEFLENLENPDSIKYIHEKVKDTLEESYGILTYQEQVSLLFQELAGYSALRAETIRRAISKKIIQLIEDEREFFIYGKDDKEGNIEILGCTRNGIPEDVAVKLFDDMVAFGKYSFNKSHGGSYGLLTYQTAYLKHHYPIEFMTSILSSACRNNDSRKKVPKYIQECIRLNIQVLPPDINKSNAKFSIEDDSKIRFGLLGIKNVGKDTCYIIEEERMKNGPFKNESDFVKRLGKTVTKKIFQALTLSGAFDSLSNTRKYNYENAERILKNKDNKPALNIFDSLLGIKSTNINDSKAEQSEFTSREKLAYEEECLGAFVSKHPLQDYDYIIKDSRTNSLEEIMIDVELDESLEENGYCSDNSLFNNGDTAKVIGYVISSTIKQGKKQKTRQGKEQEPKPYILYKITDGVKTMSGIADIKYKEKLQEGQVVHISGKVDHNPVYGTQLKNVVVSRVLNKEDKMYDKDSIYVGEDSTVEAYINHYSEIPKFLEITELERKSKTKTVLYFSCATTKKKYKFDYNIALKNEKVLSFLKENTEGLIIR